MTQAFLALAAIAVTTLISAMALALEHVTIARRSPVYRYVAGVLAMDLPLTGLLVLWAIWPPEMVVVWAILAIWVVRAVSGNTEKMLHDHDRAKRATDDAKESKKRAHLAEQVETVLRRSWDGIQEK